MVTVRPAMVLDREMLVALQWRASLRNSGDREALLANPDAVDLPIVQILNGGVFAAEEAGLVKGFAAILPRADGDSELDALFVEPEFWRRGIGLLLVEHCAARAREFGAEFLHVAGNPHAEKFYIASGFQRVGLRQMRFGVGLLMKKSLKQASQYMGPGP